MELRSFAAAATELALSKATVSKAVSRLEQRLGARLFNRTSRRLALTDAGQKLAERAARLLARRRGGGERGAGAIDGAARAGAARGADDVRRQSRRADAAGVSQQPIPEVSIDLHLSDATVDLIGEGFDAGLRIARLPDSSLIARRLCAMPRYTVAAPSYLKRHGRPTHPMHLAQHKCFGYAYLSTPGVWHYTNAAGEQASVRPAGQLRVNNGEALMPAVIAGLGIADLPDFIVGDAIASGEVEVILKGWKQPEGAVHLVTPPGGPRPARVEVLADFLAKHFAKGKKRKRSWWRGARDCPIHHRASEVGALRNHRCNLRLRCLQQRKQISGRQPPMNRRELLKAAAALPLAQTALSERGLRASRMAVAQHHHDRAVSARRPGRSRGAAGGAGAGADSRQARRSSTTAPAAAAARSAMRRRRAPSPTATRC